MRSCCFYSKQRITPLRILSIGLRSCYALARCRSGSKFIKRLRCRCPLCAACKGSYKGGGRRSGSASALPHGGRIARAPSGCYDKMPFLIWSQPPPGRIARTSFDRSSRTVMQQPPRCKRTSRAPHHAAPSPPSVALLVLPYERTSLTEHASQPYALSAVRLYPLQR